MRLSVVPLYSKVVEGEIDFHHIEVSISVGEVEVLVVQPVSANLPAAIRYLMPEVADYKTRPGSTSVDAVDGANHLYLP